MEETIVKTNLLGTEEIGKLMMRYAIPSIISLVINSLYTILCEIFMIPLCRLLGVTENSMTYALEYGRIIALGYIFVNYPTGSWMKCKLIKLMRHCF